MSFFDEYEIIVGESKKTAFVNEIGIYQDGTTPMYRDKDGIPFGNHYGSILPKGDQASPFECGNDFYICLNHNGTDVVAWDGQIHRKDV